MDALAVIENRIEQLESELGYPAHQVEDDNENDGGAPLVDQISKAEQVLNNACSGREKILEINKRLEDLNAYLDPNYVNMVNDSKMKSNYALTNEPSIRYHTKSMQLCKEKLPVLDANALSDVPKFNNTLKELNAKNLECKDQCDQTEKCIQQMMESSNQMSMAIMEKLVAISKTIDVLESTK